MNTDVATATELQAEITELRRQVEDVKRERDLLLARDKAIFGLGGLVFIGPELAKSMRIWMKRASPANPFPREEFADVITAMFVRVVRVGIIGFLLTNSILIWQNLLINSQNQYFRKQLEQIENQTQRLQEQVSFDRVESKAKRRAAYVDFYSKVQTLGGQLAIKKNLRSKGLARAEDVNVIRRLILDSYGSVASYGSRQVVQEALRLTEELIGPSLEIPDLNTFRVLVEQDLGEDFLQDVEVPQTRDPMHFLRGRQF